MSKIVSVKFHKAADQQLVTETARPRCTVWKPIGNPVTGEDAPHQRAETLDIAIAAQNAGNVTRTLTDGFSWSL